MPAVVKSTLLISLLSLACEMSKSATNWNASANVIDASVVGESPIQVPERPSAFHPHAQRNAFRRRDVRLQSRWFARKHDSAS